MLFCLTFADSVADLSVSFEVSISQHSLQVFFMLGQLLLISTFFKDDSPHFLAFLFVLNSLPDACLQETKQLVPPFLLILSSPQQINECFGGF